MERILVRVWAPAETIRSFANETNFQSILAVKQLYRGAAASSAAQNVPNGRQYAYAWALVMFQYEYSATGRLLQVGWTAKRSRLWGRVSGTHPQTPHLLRRQPIRSLLPRFLRAAALAIRPGVRAQLPHPAHR